MEKRIKIKLKDPNYLFKQWLREWIAEAEIKRKRSSKIYQRALDSLEKYPLKLWSGHDCAILEGFGGKICEMIEEKWQKHLLESSQDLCFKDRIAELQQQDIEELENIVTSIEAANLVDNSAIDDTKQKEVIDLSMIEEEEIDDNLEVPDKSLIGSNQENIRPPVPSTLEDTFDRLVKKYNPAYEPASQAKLDSPVTSKKSLKRIKSFNTNVAGPSFASSPISRNINIDKPNLKRAVTDNILSPIVPEKRRIIDNDLTPVKFSHPPPEEKEDDGRTYISVDDINPNDYEVILLIDIGEAKSKDRCEVQTKISRQDVKSEVRKLHIGDFTWIARHKTNKNAPELVLPYIIERKRLDDLASSIKDKRFHEQKFRLKQCGIENVIYLIENHNATNYGLPFESLTQAVANTLIQNRFQVKVTDNSDHTVMYLKVMTSFIYSIFQKKHPIKYKLLEFEAFNQGSIKQKKLTVRDTFIKQLLSLKGLSVDIALEITKYYPTPSHLYEKYKSLGKTEGEALLTKLTVGELKRKIPSSVSLVIYHFYMQK